MRHIIKKYGQWFVAGVIVLVVGLFLIFGQRRQRHIAQELEQADKPVIVWGVKSDTNLFGLYNIANDRIEGFDIDIARAITHEITNGQGEAQFVEVSSKTRIPLLKNGNIDAIIATMTITESRKKMVDFSDVYFEAGQALLVPPNSTITGIHDLTAGHRVIAVKGSTSAQRIREFAPDVTVIESENYSEALVALQAGQGDALTTDNAILYGMMTQAPGYYIAGDTFTEEPFGIAVDKNQEAFLQKINAALKTIKENGTYDAIYQKWFGDLIQR